MTELNDAPVPLRRHREREYLGFVIDEDGPEYLVYPTDVDTALLVHDLWGIGQDAAKGKPVAASKRILDNNEERNLYERLLGDTLTDLEADKVEWPDIQFIAQCVMTWIVAGMDAAKAIRDSGGDPKELERVKATLGNRASHRASKASAPTTKRRASGTGTKASKKPPARTSRATKS